MKIIIFGGNGFIGKHLASLLKKKNRVYIYGNIDYSKKNKNLIKYKKENFVKLIKKIKPNIIFFLGGNSYPNNTINDFLHDFKSTNLVIQELLNAMTFTSFKGLFFFASSIAVYGSVQSSKNIKENHNLNPESFYGNSKLIAEQQIRFISKNSKFKSIVLRFSSVYGPGLKRQIVYQILKQLISKKNINLYGSELDRRQFLYVKDCAKILELLVHLKYKNFQVYNVASGKKIKIINLIKILEKKLDRKINVKFFNKLKSPKLPELSNVKILKQIGNFKFTEIGTGLIETLNWIKNKN